MKDFFTNKLKDKILWFSKKSVEEQQKIILKIFESPPLTRYSLPRDEYSSILHIVMKIREILISGDYPEEDIIKSLQKLGLKHSIAASLIMGIKRILLPGEEVLLKLPPDKLREYMKAAVLFHFQRDTPESRHTQWREIRKSVEMYTIVSFLMYYIRDIDIFVGDTGFRIRGLERLKELLYDYGFNKAQIHALLTPIKTKMEETASSLYNKLKKPITPPAVPSEANFNLIFRYGVRARNELNTFKGTYTKDMVGDPFITVNLSLSKEELDRIYQKMIEIKFFEYPDKISVPPEERFSMRTPYISYYFEVGYNSKTKKLSWEDKFLYKDEKTEKLSELIKLIIDIIHSKEEYKKLPEPRSLYL